MKRVENQLLIENIKTIIEKDKHISGLFNLVNSDVFNSIRLKKDEWSKGIVVDFVSSKKFNLTLNVELKIESSAPITLQILKDKINEWLKNNQSNLVLNDLYFNVLDTNEGKK